MKRTALFILLAISCTGCQSILHEMQPHRLWRMNYTDAPVRSDGSFMSVDDPIDEDLSADQTMDPGRNSALTR